MVTTLMRKTLLIGGFVFSAIAAASSALAQDGLESRLGTLLNKERAALEAVGDAQLTALTTSIRPRARDDAAVPTQVTYSNAFLSQLPTVEGDAQWRCFAEALYFEARGETAEGLFAVGEVILNRVDSPAYPDTLCGVINQGTGRKYACQFTYTCDGRPETITERSAWKRVGKVADLLMSGAPRRLTEGATHYHTTAVNPSWARRFPKVAQYGVHVFYRQPVRTAASH